MLRSRDSRRRATAVLGIAAGLILAMAGPGASPAVAYPSCSWNPYAPVVRGGASVTLVVTCNEEPGIQYTARVTSTPPGLTATVAPGGAPNAFLLNVTAAAEVGNASVEVELTIDGGSYKTSVSVPFRLSMAAPNCSVDTPITTAAGIGVEIEVGCDETERQEHGPKLEIVEAPRHGRLTAAALDSGLGWTYTSGRRFTGRDRLSFRVRDAFGVTPVMSVEIRVRRLTAAEAHAEYHARVCAEPPPLTSCRAGRGRRTSGGAGTGKVTHRNWPPITGVYHTFPGAGGGTLRGAERNDELLGHHGSDTIFGGGGKDVIWGDWDPLNNNGRQRDYLDGGAGTDFIYTSHGRNRVRGGAGNDFIWAFYGHGTIDCGPGIDKVRLSGRERAYKLVSCERRGKF